MARILFVHNTFPGRFEFLLAPLRKAGHSLAAIAPVQQGEAPGVDVRRYAPAGRGPGQPFPLSLRAELDTRRGAGVAQVAQQLRSEGFVPDLIIGHPGWGETLFLREVFPDARQLLIGEFYYRTRFLREVFPDARQLLNRGVLLPHPGRAGRCWTAPRP